MIFIHIVSDVTEDHAKVWEYSTEEGSDGTLLLRIMFDGVLIPFSSLLSGDLSRFFLFPLPD